MKSTSKRVGKPFLWFFFLLLTVASIAGAADFGPRRRPGHRTRPNNPVAVVEPAAIVLLGAGLVSLGVYAKKKRAKKQ